jgi:hypothetical protein
MELSMLLLFACAASLVTTIIVIAFVPKFASIMRDVFELAMPCFSESSTPKRLTCTESLPKHSGRKMLPQHR